MTDHPRGIFSTAEYLALIRQDAADLLAALPAVAATAPVPGCPDWTVRDLIDHLGQVHQWVLLNGFRAPDATGPSLPTTGPAEGEELTSWYQTCLDDLLKAFAATDPAQPCWTPQPGYQEAGFWWRRMSHELAMHRTDLSAAAGQTRRYDAALAVDGIGEVLDALIGFAQRRSDATPLHLPAPLLIECADRPERWLLTQPPDRPDQHHAAGPTLPDQVAATAAAALRGPAAGLLFAIWKRQDPATAGVTVDGDAELAGRFFAATLTP
ncbi:MAG TPA: maleylpyruvate isomerase family mycothiol-dependent enzyme [Natronosporangium sp.]